MSPCLVVHGIVCMASRMTLTLFNHRMMLIIIFGFNCTLMTYVCVKGLHDGIHNTLWQLHNAHIIV